MATGAERISIVMACDEGYAMPLATALRSMSDSNVRHWPLNVYILSEGFRERTRERIRESLQDGSVALHWLNVNLGGFANLPTLAHISHMTFGKLLLADMLPRELTRVLYLDADLLVLGDLGPLWTTRLDGHLAGAVLDYGLDPLLKRQDPTCAGMPVVKRYFNAGVLLIDLDLWRQQQTGERAAQYLAKHPKSPYADQDALNVVLDDVWTTLDDQWNFQRHLEKSIPRGEQRPKIVHFITAAKPWKREFHTPNERLFEHYRRRTKFARTLSMRLADVWKTAWFLTKQKLKRIPPLRQTWYRLKSR